MLLNTLADISDHVQREEDRRALLRHHALMIERASREALAEQVERDAVPERYWSVLRILGIDRLWLKESRAKAAFAALSSKKADAAR